MRQWLHHCPGQPVPGLDNPFNEDIFPNAESKLPLVWLEAISCCSSQVMSLGDKRPLEADEGVGWELLRQQGHPRIPLAARTWCCSSCYTFKSCTNGPLPYNLPSVFWAFLHHAVDTEGLMEKAREHAGRWHFQAYETRGGWITLKCKSWRNYSQC